MNQPHSSSLRVPVLSLPFVAAGWLMMLILNGLPPATVSTLHPLVGGEAERFPSDSTVLVYLARAQGALGWKNEAALSWQAVLNRVPGHLEAKKALGRS